jgi:hypothetical protein
VSWDGSLDMVLRGSTLFERDLKEI